MNWSSIKAFAKKHSLVLLGGAFIAIALAFLVRNSSEQMFGGFPVPPATSSTGSFINLTFTNGTGTNLYATNASFGSLSFSAASVPGITWTNATGTNTTSTNLFATNAAFTNLSLTTAALTNITWTNATGTNTTSTSLYANNVGFINASGSFINLTTGGNISVNGANARRTLVLSGAGGIPTAVSPATSTQLSFSNNGENLYVLAFNATATNYAVWGVTMPDNYDGGTMNVWIDWMNASGTGNVTWNVQARAFASGSYLDAAWGTAAQATGTVLSAGFIQTTSTASALTVGGSPAGGQYTIFRASRDTSDTLQADAYIAAIRVEYGINQYTD